MATRTITPVSVGTNFTNGLNVPEGKLYIENTSINTTAAEINVLDGKETVAGNVLSFPVSTLNGGTGQKACLTNGLTLITGGTGIADMTLAAPTPGARSIIRINSLSSGSVVVTTAAGVTLNGTNNTATFDAINEALELVYSAANTWAIALNVGAVALSTV